MARLALAALLILTCPAEAGPGWPLNKLTWLEVDVSLTKDSLACGLNERELREAFLLPIRAYTQMRAEDVGDAKASIVVATVEGSLCAHAVQLEVFAFGSAKLPFGGNAPSRRMIKLYSTFGVVTAVHGSAARVVALVESLGRSFATAWQEANAKPAAAAADGDINFAE